MYDKKRKNHQSAIETLIDSLSVECNVKHSFKLNYEENASNIIKNISIIVSGLDTTKKTIVEVAEVNLVQFCTNTLVDKANCDCNDENEITEKCEYYFPSFLKLISTLINCEFGSDGNTIVKNLGILDDSGFVNCEYNELYSYMVEYLLRGNLFCVSSIIVNPKYRNIGIGEKVLKSLHILLKNITNENIVITFCATPSEVNIENGEEFCATENRLFEFCKKCGYMNIGENVFLMVY